MKPVDPPLQSRKGARAVGFPQQGQAGEEQQQADAEGGADGSGNDQQQGGEIVGWFRQDRSGGMFMRSW